MKPDRLSDNWLFQQHTKKTIATWVAKLKYFSFTRAWGVYANDGDAFRVEFMYADKQDLIFKIAQLGLTLNIISVDFPINTTAPNDGLSTQKKPLAIRRFKYFAQPCRSILFGHKVYIWISDNTISISVSGSKGDIFRQYQKKIFVPACIWKNILIF